MGLFDNLNRTTHDNGFAVGSSGKFYSTGSQTFNHWLNNTKFADTLRQATYDAAGVSPSGKVTGKPSGVLGSLAAPVSDLVDTAQSKVNGAIWSAKQAGEQLSQEPTVKGFLGLEVGSSGKFYSTGSQTFNHWLNNTKFADTLRQATYDAAGVSPSGKVTGKPSGVLGSLAAPVSDLVDTAQSKVNGAIWSAKQAGEQLSQEPTVKGFLGLEVGSSGKFYSTGSQTFNHWLNNTKFADTLRQATYDAAGVSPSGKVTGKPSGVLGSLAAPVSDLVDTAQSKVNGAIWSAKQAGEQLSQEPTVKGFLGLEVGSSGKFYSTGSQTFNHWLNNTKFADTLRQATYDAAGVSPSGKVTGKPSGVLGSLAAPVSDLVDTAQSKVNGAIWSAKQAGEQLSQEPTVKGFLGLEGTVPPSSGSGSGSFSPVAAVPSDGGTPVPAQ
ncbi:unnamed protein product, partial [Cylicocyclus nassatus]